MPPVPITTKAVPAAPLDVWPWSAMRLAGFPARVMMEPLARSGKVPLAGRCSHATVALMKDSSMMDTTISRPMASLSGSEVDMVPSEALDRGTAEGGGLALVVGVFVFVLLCCVFLF